MWRLTSKDVFRRLNGCNRLRRSFLINLISIEIGRIYRSVQRRHRPSKRPNQPIRNKYFKYMWRGKYNGGQWHRSIRGLADIQISLLQYFRLLLEYREILDIYPNERTMACAQMPTNYFVVVVLPCRQIKRVVRLTACNYERCVFLTIFSWWKIRLRRLQTIPLNKVIKKERLNRLHPIHSTV